MGCVPHGAPAPLQPRSVCSDHTAYRSSQGGQAGRCVWWAGACGAFAVAPCSAPSNTTCIEACTPMTMPLPDHGPSGPTAAQAPPRPLARHIILPLFAKYLGCHTSPACCCRCRRRLHCNHGVPAPGPDRPERWVGVLRMPCRPVAPPVLHSPACLCSELRLTTQLLDVVLCSLNAVIRRLGQLWLPAGGAGSKEADLCCLRARRELVRMHCFVS